MRTALVGLCAALVCIGCLADNADAIGLGFVVGEPTGLSFKQWMTTRSALAAAAAWSFEDESAFHAHVDYLIHRPGLAGADEGKVLFYIGIGGRLKAEEEDSRVGVRIPMGIDYVFAGTPLDIFFEVAPLVDLAPGTDFRVNGGIGLRYYF